MAVDFATSVAAWVEQAKGRADAAFRAIAADALARVKELTPVQTGYLRANWQASFDDSAMPVDQQGRGEIVGAVGGLTASSAVKAALPAPLKFVGGVAAEVAGNAGATAAAGGSPDLAQIGVGAIGGAIGSAATTAAYGARFGTPGAVVGGAVGLVGGLAGGVGAGAAYSSMKSDGNPLEKAKIGDVIYILNPVKYARAVEYGRTGQRKDGSSYNVEGRGMVQQTVSELPQIAERAVRRVMNE